MRSCNVTTERGFRASAILGFERVCKCAGAGRSAPAFIRTAGVPGWRLDSAALEFAAKEEVECVLMLCS